MTTTDQPTAQPLTLPSVLTPFTRRRTRIGLVAGGLAAYWPQFPGLLPQLQESTAYVTQRFQGLDADVVDVGFISDPQEAVVAAEKLRQADCDLVVVFLTTYLTASMVLPIAQRATAPVLVIDLQPTEAMDHASFGTGEWLAYCGQCPVPEVGNVFRRAGIPFARSRATCVRRAPGSGSTSGCTRQRSEDGCATPATASWGTSTRACWTSRPT